MGFICTFHADFHAAVTLQTGNQRFVWLFIATITERMCATKACGMDAARCDAATDEVITHGFSAPTREFAVVSIAAEAVGMSGHGNARRFVSGIQFVQHVLQGAGGVGFECRRAKIKQGIGREAEGCTCSAS